MNEHRGCSPDTPVSIYALIDPRNDSIRYVGMTTITIEIRLDRHIRCRNRNNNHKNKWIRKLISMGMTPSVVLIEIVGHSMWQKREMYWIDYCRKMGCNLVNATAGGDGFIELDDEAKQRGYRNSAKSRTGIPKSKETIEKMRQRAIERWKNPEYREKISGVMKRVYELDPSLRKRVGDAIRVSSSSDESRARRSISAKLSWQRRKSK